ncbi:MAG: CpXC domain-containing protein [Anaerolineae bacterium]|nr:CpXC domain-containing protein [Anaerolineae bacterium]
MQTQVTCPNCHTPYPAQVFQLLDVGQQPEIKEYILSGQLNMAVCPNCGAGGQISTPLVYHDPAHELFMTFVPSEMNLDHIQREQIIGSMVRQIMDATPPEKRKAYMLTPQTVLTYQTFMENILATEGITKEMIARQREQSELLGKLANADTDVRDFLIQENMKLLDEQFFAMLQQIIDYASQMNDDEQMVKLTNLRAKLMVSTPIGKEIEKRQIALHAFNREAKAQGGVSAALLLKHILRNQEDDAVVDALVMNGQGALRYEFFRQFSEEIERVEKEGDLVTAQRLTDIRTRLVKVYDEIREQSNRMLAEAAETLKLLLEAPDMETAVAENFQRLDDAFMYFLIQRINQSEEAGDAAQAAKLRQVQETIAEVADAQVPLEIRLLNQMLEADSDAEREQILDENPQLVVEEMLQVLDAVQQQVEQQGQDDVLANVKASKALIRMRLQA